jgi:sortase A
MTTVRVKSVERIVFATGLVLLTVWLGARLYSVVGSQAAIAQFESANQTESSGDVATLPDPLAKVPVDFRLWSPKRVSAYEESLALKTDPAVAILRIPKLHLEAPVFNGTDDVNLNRGLGRILGTAQIGEVGNLGLAGHRDGFFRGLQDIEMGDVIELVRAAHLDRYIVTEIRIVTPEDTSVLRPTTVPTLTLVTCFPFYFIGHAPERYIVTSQIEDDRALNSSAKEGTVSAGSGERR